MFKAKCKFNLRQSWDGKTFFLFFLSFDCRLPALTPSSTLVCHSYYNKSDDENVDGENYSLVARLTFALGKKKKKVAHNKVFVSFNPSLLLHAIGCVM